MRISLSTWHKVILCLAFVLISAVVVHQSVVADTLPPDPPIEIVGPHSSSPDTTIVSDSLSGPDSSTSDDPGLLEWLLLILTATF